MIIKTNERLITYRMNVVCYEATQVHTTSILMNPEVIIYVLILTSHIRILHQNEIFTLLFLSLLLKRYYNWTADDDFMSTLTFTECHTMQFTRWGCAAPVYKNSCAESININENSFVRNIT